VEAFEWGKIERILSSMSGYLPKTVVDLAKLRDRVNVFRDRAHAGKILAGMLDSYGNTDTMVLGIPAGVFRLLQ
jgi:hypothetical protein